MSDPLMLFSLLVMTLWIILLAIFLYLIVQKRKDARWKKEVETYKRLYEPMLRGSARKPLSLDTGMNSFRKSLARQFIPLPEEEAK